MAEIHQYGKEFERRAAEWFLQKRKDSRELARNFRTRRGEIDLIFEEMISSSQLELVFVEVKARRAGGLIPGMDSVGAGKRMRITRAAEEFLARQPHPAGLDRYHSLRFDILSWDGSNWFHIPNAWVS